MAAERRPGMTLHARKRAAVARGCRAGAEARGGGGGRPFYGRSCPGGRGALRSAAARPSPRVRPGGGRACRGGSLASPAAGDRPAPACRRGGGAAPAGARRPQGRQPGGTPRHDHPRVQQRPDHDPQLRPHGPTAPRPADPRQGPGTDPLGRHPGREDNGQHPLDVEERLRPVRADQPGAAGRGGARAARTGADEIPRAGREGVRPGAACVGQSRADPAGAPQPARQRAAGDVGGRPADPQARPRRAAGLRRPDGS